MLFTLISWIYITFLCWSWGMLFLKSLNKITGEKSNLPHLSFICLTGLSAITIIAGLLSLFIPLGNWYVQLVFLVPAILFFIPKNQPNFFKELKNQFSRLHVLSIALLISLLLMAIVMCTWKIVHPDTLIIMRKLFSGLKNSKLFPG
jgi:hypothetical protein